MTTRYAGTCEGGPHAGRLCEETKTSFKVAELMPAHRSIDNYPTVRYGNYQWNGERGVWIWEGWS